MEVDRSAPLANTKRIMRVNREDERKLVADALQRMELPVPTRGDAKLARQAGYIGVPVGTHVFRRGQNEPDVVVGARGRDLITAHRDPVTGVRNIVTGPFDAFARHSQNLLEEPATPEGFTREQLTQLRRGVHTPRGLANTLLIPHPESTTAVRFAGDNAMIQLHEIDAKLQLTGNYVDVPYGYWRSDIRQSEVLQPVATAPTSADHVANLRRLVGDQHIVVSEAGNHVRLPLMHDPGAAADIDAARARVIGTETMPGRRAGVALDRAQSIERYFHERVGTSVLPTTREAAITIDRPAYLVNASAGIDGDGRAALTLGPIDDAVAEEWLAKVPEEIREQSRATFGLLRSFEPEVLGHEGTHIDHVRRWSVPQNRIGDAIDTRSGRLADLEEGIAREGMADIGGFARTGRPDVGVRNPVKLDARLATLSQVRTQNAQLPAAFWSEHVGTQLVSAPMVPFARAHGADAAAEVLGAATRAIEVDLQAGRYEIVDIPRAASALHEAAAARLGIDHPSVRALRDGWENVGVPVRDVAYNGWGAVETRIRTSGDPVADAKRIADERRVQSALSELDRISSTKRPNSALVRQLTRIRDAETGTQLLTKPIGELGRQHGWKSVNAITADARQTLGSQLREGRFDVVSTEDAARALRDATERHFGKFTSAVDHVEHGFRALGVLQRFVR